MITRTRKTVVQNPEQFKIELSPYIPHVPTPKQTAFLLLNGYREAFYGGAAGGGKSDALLMAGLQFVDNPFYNGIIFRKTFADLRLPQALIDRSMEWLNDTDARWHGSDHKWTFPSGASLCFGYMDTELNRYRYQSAEFQYIAFDELTQQFEDDYLYLFSRLRRGACSVHQTDEKGRAIFLPETCPECRLRCSLPLRVRSASNPGGVGHIWVKERFGIEQVGDIYQGTIPSRPYLPAFLKDNPYLDQSEYAESLSNLDPITRAQLMKGDWGVSADGRIRKAWMRRYTVRGDYIVGQGKEVYMPDMLVFQTIDPAASSREGPGDEMIWRSQPSWFVIGTWLLDTSTSNLFLWHVDRFQKEVPEAVREVGNNFKYHSDSGHTPSKIGVEADGLGIGVFQLLARQGLPVVAIRTRGRDKLVRASDFITRCEAGRVYLPRSAPWLDAFEAELFTWTGHPKETDDQVDMCGHAGHMATEWSVEFLQKHQSVITEVPSAYE